MGRIAAIVTNFAKPVAYLQSTEEVVIISWRLDPVALRQGLAAARPPNGAGYSCRLDHFDLVLMRTTSGDGDRYNVSTG